MFKIVIQNLADEGLMVVPCVSFAQVLEELEHWKVIAGNYRITIIPQIPHDIEEV